jgi:hypothetical protein
MVSKVSCSSARWLCTLGALALCACSGEAAQQEGMHRETAAGEAVLVFGPDYDEHVDGTLVEDGVARIEYAPERLPRCASEQGGHLQWGITGYYQINGGEVSMIGVLQPGHFPEPVIELDEPGELAIWFRSTSVHGCTEWDSDYGNNYSFEVVDDLPE